MIHGVAVTFRFSVRLKFVESNYFMNDSLVIIFGLAIVFGAISGFLGDGSSVQPSKNLISFLFWDN
jgi:hypothetical protein